MNASIARIVSRFYVGSDTRGLYEYMLCSLLLEISRLLESSRSIAEKKVISRKCTIYDLRRKEKRDPIPLIPQNKSS